MQVYYSSDQELNINELWSVGTVRNNLANIVIASSNSVFCLLGMLICTYEVRYAIFANFDPLPCHTSSHISGPPKVRHTYRTPIFSMPSTKNPGKTPCTNFLSIVCGGFCPGGLSEGLLSGRFCPRRFLPVLPSVRIYLLQQKAKHHFKFQVSYV